MIIEPGTRRRLAAGLLVAGMLGCGREPGGSTGAVFHGEDPFAVRLAYPSSWRLAQERGRLEPYAGVRLLGPRNAEDTYTASITARGRLAPHGAESAGKTAEESARLYASQLIDGSVVESDTRRRQWGADVADVTVAYTIPPLHRRGLKPLPVPVRTRTLFIRRGEYAYQIAYSADAREYDAHRDEFDALLRSLRFP
jgi:hypothetical protein